MAFEMTFRNEPGTTRFVRPGTTFGFRRIRAARTTLLLIAFLFFGAGFTSADDRHVGPVVDFARVALACGYRTGTVIDDLDGFDQVFAAAMASEGPPLVHRYYEPNHHSDAAFHQAVRRGARQHHWRFGNMEPVPGVSPEEVGVIIRYVRNLQRKAGVY